MDANHAPAVGARPFRALVLHELLYAEIPDEFEILYRTHVVPCPVSLIQPLYRIARELFAFETKLRFGFFEGLTGFYLAREPRFGL